MVHYHIPSTDSQKVAGTGDTQVLGVAWKPGQGEVLACATSRGGKIINMEDREVVLLGTDSDRTRMTWVAWSPPGNLLVTLGDQKIIWKWDEGRITRLTTLLGQPGVRSQPKFSPSGHLVAMIREEFPGCGIIGLMINCDVYDTINGELQKSVNSCIYGYFLQNPIVWKDELSFFCPSPNDTINLWKVDEDEPIEELTRTGYGGFMAFNPEKEILAFTMAMVTRTTIGTIGLYSSDGTRGTLTTHLGGSKVVELVWKPDFSGILASRSADGQVRIWNALTKTALQTYAGARKNPLLVRPDVDDLLIYRTLYDRTAFSFSPDWNFFAKVDVDGKVTVMKVDTGETVAECEEKGVAVGWSTAGDKLAVKTVEGLNNVENVSVYNLEKITTVWKSLKVLSTTRVASLIEKNCNRDGAKEFLDNKEGFPKSLVPDVCSYLPRN